MNLEALRERYFPLIDTYFKDHILADIDEASGLKEILKYQYNFGKRLRPLCAMLSFHTCLEICSKQESKEENRYLVSLASVVELLHSATLIHDDFQDGDIYRRKLLCAWKKFSVEQAINAGDLAFFLAMHCIQKENFPSEKKLLELLGRSMRLLIEGQGQEFKIKNRWQKENYLPSIQEYETMARKKTASLFQLSMLGASIIAEAGEEEKRNILEISSVLGLAFQIRDDIIDFLGKKGREGAGNDIAEGKLSYPILLALKKLEERKDEDRRDRFREVLQKERSETRKEEIDWVIGLMENLNTQKDCMNEYKRLEEKILSTPIWGKVLAPLCTYLSMEL